MHSYKNSKSYMLNSKMQDAMFFTRRHRIFLGIVASFMLLGLISRSIGSKETNGSSTLLSTSNLVTANDNTVPAADLPGDKEPADTLGLVNEHHELPGRFNLVADAAPNNGGMRRPSKQCSLEYMNNERLQQDHPCVLNNFKKSYLDPPAPVEEPYQLDYPEVDDPSDGQARTVLHLLKNKTNGFFVECGALDGENISNTLYMERFLNWTGLLVEADMETYKNMRGRKRKSWTSQACLSSHPYPEQVTFRVSYALGHIIDEFEPLKNFSGKTSAYGENVTCQCFPLYSMLLAMGRTNVDYFSLDVEGYEPYILKTIPFDKLNITVMSIEWITTGDQYARKKEIIDYMLTQGYEPFNSRIYGADVFFVRQNDPLIQDIKDGDPLIQRFKA